MRLRYLALLLVFSCAPIGWALVRSRLAVLAVAPVFIGVIVLAALVGWGWDVVGVREGVWSFPAELDRRIFGLPLEEYAFLTLCPLSVVAMTLAFLEPARAR